MNIARRKAHTLLELIAVVAILVVVAAVGLPMIKPMLHSRDNDNAADVIRARFSHLQSKAVDGFEDDDHWVQNGDLPGEVKFDHSSDAPSKDGWVKVASFAPDNTTKQYRELKLGNVVISLPGATKTEAKP
jgi:type II secretory pathway pseudopilin PulG